MPRRALTPLLALAALLGGCGGSEEHDPNITESERRLGAEQHPQLLAEFGGSYDAPEAHYARALGERIAAKAGLEGQCTFTLVNGDVVNAFAVPGCYIYITRGMMGIVNSEAELASVLAHEVGHIVAAHSRRQQRRSLLRGLGVLAVGLLTGSEGLTQIAGQAAQYFTLRYSRGQEYEADSLGIRYLAAAGYDPYEAQDMLGALGRHEQFMARTRGRDEAQGIPEWARTHPLTANRIERAGGVAAETGVSQDGLPEKAAEYLRELDGLLYGDDPAQGFVMGRRFAHPVMRIAFEAPPGFTLTNSPEAILIEGPDGMRGEFGGSGIPQGGGLEAYVDARLRALLGQADAQVGEPQPMNVNGVSALFVPVTVRTQRGNAELSIIAYDAGGGRGYHFAMISSGGAPAGLRPLFESFRLLSPQEAASLKPRVIRTVTVGPSDTVQTLAARMASEHKVDHFLMLNGRTADEPLRRGEPVKIVELAP